VQDSSTNLYLENASVAVLHERDSILAGFAWTSIDGRFVIKGIPAGKYFLLISYPGYADFVKFFEVIIVQPQLDLELLFLSSKSHILEEVVISGKLSLLKVKGDTTEFNAGALKIEPNDKVEDLLKQIPGLQVDQNGRITAYGKTVTKVLVDGEEFFGDDPTLVTRNIRGDMVDKIQLYNKKSEKAELTGIQDNERTKTINIKLKEDKKNGYFGNVSAGSGSGSYRQAQAMYNRFRNKQKLAFFGNVSNTAKTGLSRSENDKYGIVAILFIFFQFDVNRFCSFIILNAGEFCLFTFFII